MSASSKNNTIYDNYFDNLNNSRSSSVFCNYWNISKTSGLNIIGNEWLGGNYWSNYTGIDITHDGIGDTELPYNNSGEILLGGDYLPLVISPTVGTTSPINGSSSVSISAHVIVKFDKSMNHTSTEQNFSINHGVVTTFSWDNNNKTMTVTPTTTLQYQTLYTARIQWNATDEQGNVMTENYTWSFTTQSSPSNPPPSGPGETGNKNKPPVANLSAGEPYDGYVGIPITFDGSWSNDSDGNITSWEWTFGDGKNASGEIVSHTYKRVGYYYVTLTVTDDSGDTGSVITTIHITVLNTPPTKPTIEGPTAGHIGIRYSYAMLSTDPNNDSIRYSVTWGDGANRSSGFVPNGTKVTMNHSWAAAGKYLVQVTVTDGKATASSEVTVFIDALNIGDLGYLLDANGDGTYDKFYNSTSGFETSVQLLNGKYVIDANGDGTPDYRYSLSQGLESYSTAGKKGTPGFEVVVVFGALFMILCWRRKKLF